MFRPHRKNHEFLEYVFDSSNPVAFCNNIVIYSVSKWEKFGNLRTKLSYFGNRGPLDVGMHSKLAEVQVWYHLFCITVLILIRCV
jgi:hypothetical protein